MAGLYFLNYLFDWLSLWLPIALRKPVRSMRCGVGCKMRGVELVQDIGGREPRHGSFDSSNQAGLFGAMGRNNHGRHGLPVSPAFSIPLSWEEYTDEPLLQLHW